MQYFLLLILSFHIFGFMEPDMSFTLKHIFQMSKIWFFFIEISEIMDFSLIEMTIGLIWAARPWIKLNQTKHKYDQQINNNISNISSRDIFETVYWNYYFILFYSRIA